MTRVLLFATHPSSSNGYSKIAFELAKHLSSKQDIELTYYGFQNFQKNVGHDKERQLPENVQVYDALANEKNKQLGFGFEEVCEFVTLNKPDVCIIYNDMVVVSNILESLKKVPNRKFKTMVYMDQVYLCQKKEFIKRLNEDADFVICFSKFWETCIKEQGVTKPTGVLEHGFNPMMHYPVPKKLARLYFNLKQDDFIIINANRNQPRKRLDIMMMAFAEVVCRHLGEPIKLLVATAPMGAWNLLEIYERELRIRGISFEDGMKHIIFIDNPQALTDEDMNTLFNASDIGINTAMGEGWGLCNFEAGAIGIPQIVPSIGGFLDFFDSECATMIQPKIKLYTDMTIDGCPGCAEICDAQDFADAIDRYYADDVLRKKHAETARNRILKNYKWSEIGDKLYAYIRTVAGVSKDISKKPNSSKISLDDIDMMSQNLKKNVNIDTLDDKVTKTSESKTVATKNHVVRKDEVKNRLRAKLAKKQELRQRRRIPVVEDSDDDLDLDKDELLKLKSKIDKLLKE
jgi:glycosyltransferase involved in cell wall biosynthesis